MDTKATMKRSQLREWAFCLIFEYQFNMETPLDDLYALALELNDVCDNPYLKAVFYGVCSDTPPLDAIIEKYAVGWKLNRISYVSLAIMRLCIFEMKYIDDVPVNVALNEAVELAKKYDTDEARAFINGVLNSAVKGENIV